jgi:glycosyltransferase involved in cell wall biosynthesis
MWGARPACRAGGRHVQTFNVQTFERRALCPVGCYHRLVIHGKKVTVVLPAYNAERTLRRTIEEIPEGLVDDLILVDDSSSDRTVALARELGLHTVVHDRNQGYGANQKTCYREALARGADVVVMLHPDYQYTPKLLVALASLVAIGQYDLVLGSRVLSEGALGGGMPLYKYVANRLLTLFQNILLGKKLSEYHTGYRAFSRRVLEDLPLAENSDDFLFDNQMLAQAAYFGFSIGEVSCPANYFPEASSIDLRRSVVYGLGVLGTSLEYRLAKWRLLESRVFPRRDSHPGSDRGAAGRP